MRRASKTLTAAVPFVRRYAKALVAAVPFLLAAVKVLSDALGDGSVSGQEWCAVAAAFFTAVGVYAVPNRGPQLGAAPPAAAGGREPVQPSGTPARFSSSLRPRPGFGKSARRRRR